MSEHLTSWSCKGCTNLCYRLDAQTGEINKYCRTTYEQPNNKGLLWEGNHLKCLDYTTDASATNNQVEIWSEPKYKQKVRERRR